MTKNCIFNSAYILKGSPIDIATKMLFIPLQKLFYIIYNINNNSIIKDKIIIFTNLYYVGNPRAVYERMLERNNKYKIYWMTSNISEFLKMRKENKPVLYKHGILSIKIYVSADLWILAHRGAMNIPYFLKYKYKELNKIQLEHGVGPKATHGEGREYDIYSATCLSSENIKKRHIELWGAPEDKLYATGFARLDTLLKYLKKDRDSILKELGLPIEYKKIVIYAPTYDLGLWPWGDPYEGLEKIAKFLKSYDTLLLVRPHPYTMYNKKKLKKIVKRNKNMVFVPMEKYPEAQSILAVSDILITDWSSIYTDFLVTRRPIIFLEVNKKFFLEERHENVKPEVPPEMRPGVKISDGKELYKALKKVIMENYIPDVEFYEKCLRFIHGNPDGHYSDRVINVIQKVMDRK